MRIGALALLLPIASCGWIAGLGSYGERGSDDAGTGMLSDADAGSSGSASCVGALALGGKCPTSLTAGVGETCVIAPDAMYCWGQNLLGTAERADAAVKIELSQTPISVQLSSTVDSPSTIGVGCYLEGSGNALTCWGDSSWGQAQILISNEPGKLIAPQGVTAYAVGADHVCATTEGFQTILCWGRSDEDQLDVANAGAACNAGTCSLVYQQTPDVLTTGAFVAGGSHTCVGSNALGDANDIACWGLNDKGQLGGDSGAGFDTVETVASTSGAGELGSASELALGADHTCALVDGATYCWGANDQGQLGVMGATVTHFPLAVTHAPAFAHIAAGTNTTCAIDLSGNVWCWGDNVQGECGQSGLLSGPIPQTVFEPLKVPNVANATMIAVGDQHACAELANGDIMCWGDDTNGELGDNKQMDSSCSLGPCSPNPVLVTK
ncbi:MAG TPA: hypothetical protein VGG28_00050 [Kofleriaceae bacterium]|jgi:hypothetical protein